MTTLGPVALAAVSARAQDSSPPPAPPEEIAEGEVVVTAQKREERLQDVPLSISAISGATLERAGVTNVDDLATFTPNLTYAEFNSSDPNIYIRGIGSHFDGGSLERSVAVFVDDVYLGRAAGGTSDLFDLDRVEVLRGPQGTLFGKNTVGGAINMISAAPRSSPYFKLNLEAGNYGTVNARAVASGPIVEGLNGRISAVARRRDGYARSVLTGQELEDMDSVGIRGSVASSSIDNLKVTLSGDYYKRTGGALNKFAVSKVSTVYTKANGPSRRANFIPDGRQDNETWGTSLRAVWAVGPGSVTSISAIRGSRSNIDVALAGVRVDRSLPALSAPFNLDHNVIDEKATQYSQELRFNSDFAGPFSFVAGAFLYHEQVDRVERSNIVFLANVPNQFSNYQTANKATSYAFFVDGTYQVTDALSLTAGLRYTKDDKSTRNIASSNRFPTGGFPFDVSADTSAGAFTPRATVKYQVAPNSMVYATYSKGFKSGGFDGQPTSAAAARFALEPEKVANYELGTKNAFFNRRVTLDLSVFHMSYTNLQVQSLITVPGNAIPTTALYNAGKADVNGVEVSGSVRVLPQTRVGFNYGYLDARFKSDLIVSGSNVNGNRLERAPKHTFGVTLNHSSSLSDDYALDVDGSYTFSGKYYSEIENNENSAVSSFGVLDGQLRFRSKKDGWYVGIWGKNLTNKYYPNYVLLTANTGFVNYAAPRTYGGSVGFEF